MQTLVLQAPGGKLQLVLPSAHPQYPDLRPACRLEVFKSILKVLDYIKKISEIYLRELNSSSKLSTWASVWSIH